MAPSRLTLSDLERSKSISLGFQSLISQKGAELGHKSILNIDTKPYIGSQMARPHFMLSDLETSNPWSLYLSGRRFARYVHIC